MARGMSFSGVVLFLLVFAVALGIFIVLRHGVSARDQPTQAEIFVARRLRHLAIPASARALTSPQPSSPASVKAGMEHFADHCALCHGNDGSGDTEMGAGLYPKPPDMRKEDTQSLSDGELFYIIENGVRFTGMPGWGSGSEEGEGKEAKDAKGAKEATGVKDAKTEANSGAADTGHADHEQADHEHAGHEGDHGTWPLVHFIRHLPKLTDAELQEMKALNPKGPDEWEQEQQMKEFLKGSGELPKAPAESSGHEHHEHPPK